MNRVTQDKYKAWEPNLREIIQVTSINHFTKMINEDSIWRTFDEVELLKYVGLKDKDGMEIYDRYIVEAELIDGYKRLTVVCSEHDEEFKFKDKVQNTIDTNSINLGTLRVIGDMFTSPELLD